MREADIVGIFGESSSEQGRRQTEVLHRLGFSGPIIHFEYQLESWRNLEGKSVEFPMLLEGGGAGAFCGLARPGSFFSGLVSRGVTPVQTWRFADHHRYQRRDLDSLAAQARQAGLDILITTEKDVVKLARFTDPGVRIIYPDVRLLPGRGAEEFNRVVESAIGRQIHN